MPAPRRIVLPSRARVAISAQALAILALAGVLAPPGGASSRAQDGRASPAARLTPAAGAPPTPSAGPPAAPPAAAIRYRPVGCLRRGPAVAYRGGPPRKMVALTFDDGPAPDTAAFVTMLERSHASATFFMIGREVTGAFHATLARELRDGDALGNHTFTHPFLTRTGDVQGQLATTQRAIRNVSGYSPCVFRPPYGAVDASVVATAGSQGLGTILWNVDPSDFAQPGVGAIEQRVLAQVQPGSIIISHDGGGPRGQTLAAYPAIIHSLRLRGYRLVTVPQLLGFRPIYRRCVSECDGDGLKGPLPRGAIVERG
jgi:peptidoglycan/xylan/chitin deacetylase (PgdA/CDA1 family)